jgi:thiamine biosynthesis lipoprotein
LTWGEASTTQIDVKQQVNNWMSITEGYFNPVSPEGVYDPSGLVKTWATRNAAIYLEANGYLDFTINAGGDIYIGPQVSTSPLTRVGLSNLKPISSKDAAVNMVLDLEGTDFRAVATSGSAERGEHIWAGKSANSTKEFIQATVAAVDILTADIWATALIAGGLEALDLFESKVDPAVAVAMITTANGKIISTSGFSQILANLK